MDSTIKLSQSMMKDLERVDCCPHKFYDRWIRKNDWYEKNNSSVAQDRGKYFEYLAIGGGSDYGDDVTELPLNKNGTKPIATKRIEAQAEKFKRMFDPQDVLYLGHEITETQVKMIGRNTQGTLDFKTKAVADTEFNRNHDIEVGDEIVWDLKLTADVNSDPKFNPFSWADVNRVDFTQQIYYSMLHKKVYGTLPKMFVMVFDYTAQKNVKIIKVNISPSAKRDVIERARGGVEFLHSLGEDNDRIPSKFECESCPLKCNERIDDNHIEYEQIDL